MGGEAGVLERQISSFTLAVDGGLFIQFHDRTQVGLPSSDPSLQLHSDYLAGLHTGHETSCTMERRP